MLIDRLGHLKHVQLFAAENGLQLVISEDLALVRWILKLILLDVRPNLFRDLTARKRFHADNFGEDISYTFFEVRTFTFLKRTFIFCARPQMPPKSTKNEFSPNVLFVGGRNHPAWFRSPQVTSVIVRHMSQ